MGRGREEEGGREGYREEGGREETVLRTRNGRTLTLADLCRLWCNVAQAVHVCAEHKKLDKLMKHLERVRASAAAGSAAGGREREGEAGDDPAGKDARKGGGGGGGGGVRNAPRVLVFCNRVKAVRFIAASLAKQVRSPG